MHGATNNNNMHSQIIERLKASGVFDQFRKECIADVDTKPAYINLHSRVVQSVDDYLKNVHWSSKLVRFNVREGMRKQIVDSSYFQKGVDRIVNQTVNPKINTTFFPVIENAVYEFLGLQKPKDEPNEELDLEEEDRQFWDQPMDIDPPQESNGESQGLKPNVKPSMDDVKPDISVKQEDDELTGDGNLVIVENQAPAVEKVEDEDEEESPPFEAIGFVSPPHPYPVCSAVPFTEPATPPKCSAISSEVDVKVTDFSSVCFVKPPEKQLSNDSSDVGDNVFSQGTPEKKESSKYTSSKERGSTSSTSNKSASDKEKEKEKQSSSSSKDRSSSSSRSKSSSKHRDHSSSRDKDKSYSDKSSDRDKDKNKKESSSSSKYSSKSSDSKYSRSSHSSSSRRHSSASRSKDNGKGSTSEKSKTSEDKSGSSSSKHKDYKSSSSSHKDSTSSRSHSSSSKPQDKNKYSSSSSKKSSSRNDYKYSKSKSSSKTEKERLDSQRSSDDSSNKAKPESYGAEELQDSSIPNHSEAMDSLPSVQGQLSPDVNAGGVASNDGSYNTSPSQITMADHEESAMDKWYSSGMEPTSSSTPCDPSEMSFSNNKLKLPNGTKPTFQDDVDIVSSTSPMSDRDDDSSSFVYSPSIPAKSEPFHEPRKIMGNNLKHISSGSKSIFTDKRKRKENQEQLINSLRAIVNSEEFTQKRNYLYRFEDPFFDDRNISVPASPPRWTNNLVTLENCTVTQKMVKWLQSQGARIYFKQQ